MNIARQTAGGIGAAEFAGDDTTQLAIIGFVVGVLGEQADFARVLQLAKSRFSKYQSGFDYFLIANEQWFPQRTRHP